MCKFVNNTKHSRIDKCMRRVIGLLKDHYKIVGCCCGHRKYFPTIVCELNGKIVEIFSWIVIPRTRNFYKKDKQGYYYIPEVLEGLKTTNKSR